jgi:TatD DNase family protein
VGDRSAYEARQRQAFAAQIELAAELDKPLMIHCRDAYPETLAMLTKAHAKYGERVRGNFHFFAGTLEQAQQILDLGFTMSFTGVITFAKDYEELVRFVPLDRMHIETDCPYVTPAPHRGKRNEPTYVSEVAKKIAESKGEDVEHVRAQLVQNAVSFFGL